MSKSSLGQLNEELLQIDADLARLDEQEREAELGIDSFALKARRGDTNAQKQIEEYEALRATVSNSRRRMKAARASIDAEVQLVQTTAAAEARRDKAREAQKILEALRKRGADMDAGLRKLVEDYTAIQADMATLCALGATKINPELVGANCRRAMRSALQPLRADLEMSANAAIPGANICAVGGPVGRWCRANSQRNPKIRRLNAARRSVRSRE
jgi:hypothetical protein